MGNQQGKAALSRGKSLRRQASTAHRVLISDSIEPSCYELEIEVNRGGNFLFQGNVKILCEVNCAGVQSLTLHSKELACKSCSFVPGGQVEKKVEAVRISYDLELSTVTFEFKQALAVGEGVFEIDYHGLHNDQMAGFYRSKGKEDAVILSTQFEALDARRCFPCMDEPGRKATFKASIVMEDAGLTALSNMPVTSDSLLDDGVRRRVVFGETPKMSTYLLAFVIGRFEYVERKTEHGVLIRVYTQPGSKDQGSFALDVGVKSLDFFDDVFDEPYPLPKLDMIAIPEFAAGAMENWGLVTYREVDLLIDEKSASSSQKQRVAEVVAHELAHQWFGNLVTMEWWNGLWLNEGFATWMSNLAMAEIFPDWQIWDQFVETMQARAMSLDGLVSSHPIQVPIAHAEEVEQVFDAISYFKGASVIRMVHSYLGKENFLKGLRSYIKEFKYQNTETVDLWRAWGAASGLPVEQVMSAWTLQMGFPVVTVHKAEWSEDGKKCTLDLEQKWFVADGSEPKGSSTKLWSIPLIASVGGKVVNLGVMDKRKQRFEVEASGKTWIKLNGEQHVPMRVNYGPVADEFNRSFATAIKNSEMADTDRIGLLLDYFALAKAGILDPGELAGLLLAYNNETSTPVFAALEGVIMGLQRILSGGQDKVLASSFNEFCGRLILKAANAVGWDAKSSDGHLTKLLRTAVVRLQSTFMISVPAVQKNASERFKRFAADPKNKNVLPAEIRTNVIQIALQTAPLTDQSGNYQICLKLIDQADSTQEKKEIYAAIGYISNMGLKRKTLDWCTSGAIKKQDFFYPIASVSGSGPEGRELCFAYLQENFDRIVDMVKTASPSILAAAVTYSCSGFASDSRADEIEKFFNDRKHMTPVKQISRKVEQIVEATRTNAKFLGRILASTKFQEALKKQ